MTINVRVATKEDMLNVFAMIKGLANTLGEQKFLVTDEQELLDDWGKYECVVAENDKGELVGYISFSYFYLSWRGHSIYLDDLYVDENYRRENVGTLLMDYLFARAKDEKVKCVRWYVLKENTTAVNFYKKYGVSFEENRYRCNYFVDLT